MEGYNCHKYGTICLTRLIERGFYNHSVRYRADIGDRITRLRWRWAEHLARFGDGKWYKAIAGDQGAQEAVADH